MIPAFDLTKPNLIFQTEKPWVDTDIPDGSTIQPDGWLLFKQEKCLFKQLQNHDTGEVVGILYRGPRIKGYTTLGESQVRSRRNEYARRADAGEVSEAVEHGFKVWDWALRLFDTTQEVTAENLKTIHQPEEAVAP